MRGLFRTPFKEIDHSQVVERVWMIGKQLKYAAEHRDRLFIRLSHNEALGVLVMNVYICRTAAD